MTRYGVYSGYDEEYGEYLYHDPSDAPYTIELTDEEYADYQRIEAEREAWQKRLAEQKVWQPPEVRAGTIRRKALERAMRVRASRLNADCFWHLCEENDSDDLFTVDGHDYCGVHAPIVIELKRIAEADGNRKEWWAYEVSH